MASTSTAGIHTDDSSSYESVEQSRNQPLTSKEKLKKLILTFICTLVVSFVVVTLLSLAIWGFATVGDNSICNQTCPSGYERQGTECLKKSTPQPEKPVMSVGAAVGISLAILLFIVGVGFAVKHFCYLRGKSKFVGEAVPPLTSNKDVRVELE